MVVDDVEDDGEAALVRGVDEAPEIIGLAVKAIRREEIDPVVSLSECTREFVHRHDLDARDPGVGQGIEMIDRGSERTFAREGADVNLGDDLAA